jgi:hypothetical protein
VDLLHAEVRTCIPEFARRFASARPFRHVVFDQFLRPEAIEALIAGFPFFDSRNALNELGEVGRKAVIPRLASIGPAYKGLDRLMRDKSFLHLMSEVTDIPRLVYDPEYVGGGTHENLVRIWMSMSTSTFIRRAGCTGGSI